jgi:hypothetical protein
VHLLDLLDTNHRRTPMDIRTQAIVEAVQRHANRYYTEGWDVVVECFSAEELAEEIGACSEIADLDAAVQAAIQKVGEFVTVQTMRRQEVMAHVDPVERPWGPTPEDS